VAQALNIVTNQDKGTLRVVLHRLKKDGIIQKSGKRDGEYVKIDREMKPIDWKNAPVDEYKVKLPLFLNDVVSIFPKNILVVGGFSNSGKGHPDGTPILTPGGWVPIERLSVGDKVFSGDGSQTEITGVFPRGLQQTFRFTFNDKSSIVTDWEHLWDVQFDYHRRVANTGRGTPNKGFGKWSTRPTYQLLGRCGLGKIGTTKGFIVPRVAPIQIDGEKNLPVDPYILGLLLGDGHFKVNAKGYGTVMYSSADGELLDAVRKGYEIRHMGKYDYSVIGAIHDVRKLSLQGTRSWDKFVPKEYLFNSADVRLAVLRGLMDTDGDVSKCGRTVCFSTVSPRLAEDVKFLAESLGARVSTSSRRTHYTLHGEKKRGRLSYRLFIASRTFNPFSLKRKADRYRPQVKIIEKRVVSIDNAGLQKTTCISVAHPSGLYVTNDFIVTHNTAVALDIARYNQDTHHVKYFSSEMGDSELKLRLSKWEGIKPEEWKIDFYERSHDFPGVIDPDGLNIIDYLEVNDEFWKVGQMLTDIHDRLRGGICVVCVQKNAGNDYGRGGTFGAEKPRLYLSVDRVDGRNVMKIVKAKNWKGATNPNNKSIFFKIIGGWKLLPDGQWGYPNLGGKR
jgi:hypothetical protein